MAQDPNTYFNEKIYHGTLDEGLLTSIVKLLIAPKFKKRLQKLGKHADEDPEFKSAMIDYVQQGKRLRDIMNGICDRNPDFPDCTKKSIRRRHRG